MPIGDERSEFELKLEFTEDELARFAGSAELAARTIGEPRTQRLVSTYFDTPDRRLRDAGMTLRIRDVGGALIQTAKVGTQVTGGVSNPLESEAPAIRGSPHPAAIPDEDVRRRMLEAASFRALRPVFTTDIVRTRRIVELGGARAELALDTGEVVAGRRRAPIREVELERLAGDAQAFLLLAETLLAGRTLRFSGRTKSDRGHALIDGDDGPTAPRLAAEVALDPGMDGAACFAAIAAEAADQVLANWTALAGNDGPEYAHQLRIGLRRLRSALRLCRPALDGPDLRALSRELGRIGRSVGRLRNHDVLGVDIVRPALAGNDEAAADRLCALIDALCRSEREAARAMLADPARNGLLLRLALLPYGADWPVPTPVAGRELARLALARAWRKARRRGRRLDALDIAERHRLRKDLKVLRYGLEFFASLMPKARTARFLRRLKALQDGFGYLNDVALAQALPDLLPPDASRDPDMQRCLGTVLGWHSALALREWALTRQRWAELDALPEPWR